MPLTPTTELSGTAELVYKALMACEDDDEAVLLGRMLVGDLYLHDLFAHQDEISKAYGAHIEKRANALATGLAYEVREGIAKGANMDAEIELLEELSKATFGAAMGEDDAREYKRNDRGQFDGSGSVRRAQRARMRYDDVVAGKHVVAHERIAHSTAGPVRGSVAGRLGIPDPGKAPGVESLSPQQRARFQSAYVQTQALLRPFSRMPEGAAFGHAVYTDGTEDLFGIPRDGVPVGGEGFEGLNPNKTVSSVKVSVLPTEDIGGATYAGVAGLGGSPSRAAMAASIYGAGGIGNADTMAGLSDPSGDWLRRGDDEQFSTAPRNFRRLHAASTIIDDSFGQALDPKARMALKVAQHVGEYGPEAQKVLGPTADRAAYRYRGVERPPEQGVTLSVAAVRGNPNLSPAQKNRGATHGLTREDGTWEAGPLLTKMRGLLPKQELNRLHLASGTVPPSEGVLIDRNGQVVTQAVGYGDDHYLPFNLKALAKLKGGQYVRTRTLGGPTTEDLYAGLMSGARSMTVVSHNGVYTIDFDPNLKGGRRFNDKAARMVGRYGQLLDAVESRQVEGEIPGARRAELKAAAAKSFDPERNPEGYQKELARLETRERREPTLSQQAKVAAAQDFFTERALRVDSPQGDELSGQQMMDAWVSQRAQQQIATMTADNRRAAQAHSRARAQAGGMGVTPEVFDEQYPAPTGTVLDLATAKRAIVAQYTVQGDTLKTFQNFADAMGIRPGLDQALEEATKANKDAMSPLALNGRGYGTALDALKEQFPYYIDNVEFHPWMDGTNATDTGYVAPRHLRPVKALAGYFNDKVNGGLGKVTADSIRGQNQRSLNRVGRREGETPKSTAGKAGDDKTPASNLSQADKDDLKGAAVDAAAAHLRELADGEFAATAKIRGTSVAGESVRAALTGTPIAELNPLRAFIDLPEPEYARKSLAERERLVSQAMNVATGKLPVDEEIAATLRRGGLAEAETRLPARPNAILAPQELLKDHDFDGAEAYTKGSNAGLADIAQAYRDDQGISELMSEGLLPALDVFTDDTSLLQPQLDTAAKAVRQQAAARLSWVQNQNRPGQGPEPVAEDVLLRRAEGVARAHQLARRYTEALRARELNTDTEVIQQAGAFDPDTGKVTQIHTAADLDSLWGTPEPPKPAIGS